ncbi:hypothetical protein [Herbidospora cretacea]|uniref:hypothetical protein n=1 Tax=Herbidospora cretacea TaxID=28444 RepID=UPI000773169D|nr:hypothetical protein [Herbidospora cretacea]
MFRGPIPIPPALPAAVMVLLAALWGLSVYAGWGLEAFCSGGVTAEECAGRMTLVTAVSSLFAVVATALTIGAWLTWRASLLVYAIAAWMGAEGVLFVGGLVAQ